MNILQEVSFDTRPEDQRRVIEVARALMIRDGYELNDILTAAERNDQRAQEAVYHAASIVNFLRDEFSLEFSLKASVHTE